jgi:cytochrome c oxidase subunit 2
MQSANQRIAFCAALVALALAGCQPVPVDSAARGEVLFSRCAFCHMADGAGNPELMAPTIAGMEEWYVEEQLNAFRNGARGAHFEDFPGMRMRPIAMTLRSEKDVADVATFVASMTPVKPAATLHGGDAKAGAAKYGICVQCHGPDGKGYAGTQNTMGQVKQIPGLAGQSDWYLQTQIQNFKSKIRGTNAAPGSDKFMMANVWVNTMASEQDVLDVLAHIQTLD